MTKKIFTATFANGEIVARTTTRSYSHAWRTFNKHTGKTIAVGFSGSRELAHRQLKLWVARVDVASEVVEAELVKKGPKKPPFRVKRGYTGENRGYFVTGPSRQHLRFDTRGEAQRWIDNASVNRIGVTWEIVED